MKVNKKIMIFLLICVCLLSLVNGSIAVEEVTVTPVAVNVAETGEVAKEKITLDDIQAVYGIMQKEFDAGALMDDVIEETKTQISNLNLKQTLIDKILRSH